MAIQEAREVAIGRPPTEIFTHLAAVERWPEWLIASGITEVTRTTGEPALMIGSRLRIVQVLAGIRTSTVEAQVTTFDADSRLAISGRDADGIEIAIDARITGQGTGSMLSWDLRIGLPFRLRIFERMAAPQVRRAIALDLEAFRRRLESVADG